MLWTALIIALYEHIYSRALNLFHWYLKYCTVENLILTQPHMRLGDFDTLWMQISQPKIVFFLLHTNWKQVLMTENCLATNTKQGSIWLTFFHFLFNSDDKIVQNSPLKEIQHDESSVDSPIKKTNKKTGGARKRIASSSEEENGSPKKGNGHSLLLLFYAFSASNYVMSRC